MSIPLYWWKTRANFGDLLSPIIVSHVSRHKVQYSEKPGKLLALGSILGSVAEGDCVWGSGIRGRPVKTKNIRVFAVRGPKTRDVLHRYDIDCPAVYGDPAWLMPQIYDPNIDKRYKTAVLPHYSDVRLRRLALQSDVQLLSTSDPPKEVIDGILAAERLVTSSLHGLIIAEAYGVPVVLWRDVGHQREKQFKFQDYFLSTGREDHTVWNVSLEDAIKRIPEIPKPDPIDTLKLVAAFPRSVFSATTTETK